MSFNQPIDWAAVEVIDWDGTTDIDANLTASNPDWNGITHIDRNFTTSNFDAWMNPSDRLDQLWPGEPVHRHNLPEVSMKSKISNSNKDYESHNKWLGPLSGATQEEYQFTLDDSQAGKADQTTITKPQAVNKPQSKKEDQSTMDKYLAGKTCQLSIRRSQAKLIANKSDGSPQLTSSGDRLIRLFRRSCKSLFCGA